MLSISWPDYTAQKDGGVMLELREEQCTPGNILLEDTSEGSDAFSLPSDFLMGLVVFPHFVFFWCSSV